MGKNPAFQFYVKDWLSDPQLQSTSSSTRGIWINALCCMWESNERGKISGTEEELAKLLRASNGDFNIFLEELKRHKFADVTNCNNEITLINRRMLREQKERENTRLRVAKFRSNKKGNINVTVSSPSPTPFPIPKKKNILDFSCPKFDEWWETYPRRKGVRAGKSECKSFFISNIKESDYLDLFTATVNYSKGVGEYAKDPIRFLKNDFWKDWIRVEEETQIAPTDPLDRKLWEIEQLRRKQDGHIKPTEKLY